MRVEAVDHVEAEVRELVRRRGLDPAVEAAAVRRLVDEVVGDYEERTLTSDLPALGDPLHSARAVYDAVAGYGPLQRHLDDPEVEEIWINEPGPLPQARQLERPSARALVAVGTAALFAGLAARLGPSAALPGILYLAAVGVPLGIADLTQRRLPDRLTLPSYPIGAVLLAINRAAGTADLGGLAAPGKVAEAVGLSRSSRNGAAASVVPDEPPTDEDEQTVVQKTTVQLVDDIDGSEAEETVSFALDGTSYEIDLSGEHANALREALAPYVVAARKAGGGTANGRRGGGRRGSGGSSSPAGSDRERTAQIRQWAREQGLEVNERGRIPSKVVQAYEAAH